MPHSTFSQTKFYNYFGECGYIFHRHSIECTSVFASREYQFLGSIPASLWLIFTRSSTSLEICRWFPQIVFILLTRVRPINVGFSNVFFCLSDKRFLYVIINLFLKKINPTVRFLPLKITFFGWFENYNILSSKSYMVTKSGISPQRKLGFLQNF